jgi:threonine/homoserine/homoserine lactone efflux protein
MVRIVQDRLPAAVVYSGSMDELLGLAGLAFVVSITPGPNNALLWASGVRFGFRRTAPHVAGTALGIGALILAMAAGVGILLSAVPGATLALKVLGSAYLVLLAFRIARSRGADQTATARPLGVLHGAAFQFANPKGWLFALAAVGTFRPLGLGPLAGGLVVAATCAVVVLGPAAVWAAGGATLARIVENRRAERAISFTLALVLAASVAFIWA